LIFVFYTIPLTAASKLANPEDLGRFLPKLNGVSDERALELTVLLSGFLTAGIWSAFFALCPILFKVRARVAVCSPLVLAKNMDILTYCFLIPI